MKASIIGTGYVGLVTGACLADVGNDVMCFDVDQRKIDMLRRGEIPIFEPGLKEVVQQQRGGRAPVVHDGPEGKRALRQGADDRRGHAAGRGRFRRPAIRDRRGAQHRHAHGRAARDRGQVHRAGGHGRQGPRRGGRRRSSRAARRITSRWCPIPSSSRKARRSTTSCVPTASSIGTEDARRDRHHARALRAVPAQPRSPAA